MVAAPSIGCADATDLGWVVVVGAATHMITMFSLIKVSSSSCRQCCYCSCGLGHNTAPVQQALVTVKTRKHLLHFQTNILNQSHSGVGWWLHHQ